MNVMNSSGLDLGYLSPPNPCFGCNSMACRFCPCAGEQPKEKLFLSKVKAEKPQKPKKQAERSKETTEPKMSTAAIVPNKPRSFANLPKGIFGSVGKGLILQADSNGMINAGIHMGDWLVFDTQLTPKDGDIAFITVDGQPMCRRIFIEGEMKRVRREDGVTPDVVTGNCIVYAVLIGLMRNVRVGC